MLLGHLPLIASWGPPTQFPSSAVNADLQPQISASGAENAAAVWVENIGGGLTQIKASVFQHKSWQNVQTISSSTANLQFPCVAMYKTGHAVAVLPIQEALQRLSQMVKSILLALNMI